ncbi:hypothetical protein E5288_WYG001226 [Bos mutus]|uniref:Uncharacterized protein n=1 Tax=Bos mutus TaxID=72004 RepID=A0A6B0S4M9_9CETA|nr:hypothetical protein [Bos mutus]
MAKQNILSNFKKGRDIDSIDCLEIYVTDPPKRVLRGQGSALLNFDPPCLTQCLTNRSL